MSSARCHGEGGAERSPCCGQVEERPGKRRHTGAGGTTGRVRGRRARKRARAPATPPNVREEGAQAPTSHGAGQGGGHWSELPAQDPQLQGQVASGRQQEPECWGPEWRGLSTLQPGPPGRQGAEQGGGHWPELPAQAPDCRAWAPGHAARTSGCGRCAAGATLGRGTQRRPGAEAGAGMRPAPPHKHNRRPALSHWQPRDQAQRWAAMLR